MKKVIVLGNIYIFVYYNTKKHLPIEKIFYLFNT